MQARIFAETHQKIIEKTVEKPVFYDKCMKCERTSYQKAKEKYKKASDKLEHRYMAKIAGIHAVLTGFAGYSLITTLFAAIRSKSFLNDFIAFFKVVWNMVAHVAALFLFVSRYAAQAGKKIPNEAAANILYWLIFIIVTATVFVGAVIGLCFIFIKIKNFYQENCGDVLSVMVTTLCMALLVYFGDWIRDLVSVNLIVIFLLIQVVYVAVRCYINACKTVRGYD